MAIREEVALLIVQPRKNHDEVEEMSEHDTGVKISNNYGGKSREKKQCKKTESKVLLLLLSGAEIGSRWESNEAQLLLCWN